MAGSSFFALLDDIASVLDDVATMTKVATKKTAGVLGDDLALNAEQVAGVKADRELAVVWAVAKGSAVNKVILVPTALLLSQFAPWAVVPLLMIGGAFLCFEGAEKLAHKLLHSKEEEEAKKAHVEAVADPSVDLVTLEKQKIKGAIRTDFILSAEIVIISLGAMTEVTFTTRLASLVAVSVLMTVGVYGLVAGIVKLDDAGLALSKKGAAARALGRALLLGAPVLMRFLSIAGTAAMFLVGGGILAHGVPAVEHAIDGVAGKAGSLGWLVSMLGTGLLGVVAGLILVALVAPFAWVAKKLKRQPTNA
ncbi:MAG: DUF808 domain-containing protein [Myxococcales bacterium]|nr:DUF808 domain-containing protein [Myxococcales bacterium]